jgi:aspartate kinase
MKDTKAGFDLINAHFSFLENNTYQTIFKNTGKINFGGRRTDIHLIISHSSPGKGSVPFLLPALNFMRIDKDGEPDSFYIAENVNRELENMPMKTLS